MNKEKELETSCEEEMLIPGMSPYGMPSPILSIRNHIYLNSEIDETISRVFISALYEMALSIASTSLDSGLEPCPIEIHINSHGGIVEDGFQIIQTIKNIQKGNILKVGYVNIPIAVNTHIEGSADSMASVIASIGNHRTISKYATCLLHNVKQLGGGGGHASDIKDEADNLEIIEKIFKDCYKEHSKLTDEELDDIMKHEKAYVPEQLLKWGLVDEIVS